MTVAQKIMYLLIHSSANNTLGTYKFLLLLFVFFLSKQPNSRTVSKSCTINNGLIKIKI